MKDRDCMNCINHLGENGCTKWTCKMETLKDFEERIRAEAFDEGYQACYEKFVDVAEQLKEQK